MRNVLFGLFTLLISCQSQPSSNAEEKRWNDHVNNTTIIRDDFGVPHIYGKSDADAVFGLIYAQCEDDFKRVERNYVWAIGRLAEIEGEDALYSDLRARLYMTRDEAISEFENSPDWLKKLCVAWADGINYFLHTNPDVKPDLLTRFEPWMPMYFSEGSIGGDIERVSTARIRAFYEDKKGLSLNNHGDGLEHPDEYEEPAGSNGFAISGELTESGNTMLLINPHTSFYFRGEVHVVSEEGLNAYGAVTWGQFFVYQGFNETTGWMHTSTYTDVIDEYLEEVISEGDELFYNHGDEKRPLFTSEVTLKYKSGDALLSETFPIYRTHHGPITHMIDDKWVSTALMWKPSMALQQSYLRTKQDNHESFWEMMKIRTNSSNNTVYADAEGNIAYYHGNFIPKRDTLFDFTKPVDGSNPACDWQGLHELDDIITVVNPPNGWIQNCNSTPYTSAAAYSPKKKDFERYMSIDRENFRGIHANRLLPTQEDLTLDKLIEIAYDPSLPAFEVLIPGLVEAIDGIKTSDRKIKEAANVLRDWDYKTHVNSVAMTLAHFYGMTCIRDGENPRNLSRLKLIEYFGKDAPKGERVRLFQQVMQMLEDDFGDWDIEWGEVNRFQRLNGDIDLPFDDSKESLPVGLASGRWGALASYGASRREGTKKLYGSSGNSFVAVVEFGNHVKAKSLLAGGQSGDPNSPHFYDQAQRYVDVAFKDVAFYKDDVEKRATRTYRPGVK